MGFSGKKNTERGRVFLASDHAGFALKEKIKSFLQGEEVDNNMFSVEDLTPRIVEGDDYPDVAFAGGKRVAKTKDSRGVFICGTGEGMCISANKVKGVRACLGYDEKSARLSREHNDSNVLCLGGRVLKPKEAVSIVKVWLSSRFLGERHKRRVDKISSYEKFRI
ncbi:ribose 5-phosphate isomerase B [Candidatus Woesearchaeota archaeon]|nr:ribose 5-phosphate isomerase B [Candidatus Woesearchaeota archaeon]